MLNTDYEQAFTYVSSLNILLIFYFFITPFGERMYISYVYFTGVC